MILFAVDEAAAKHDPTGAACAWRGVVSHIFMGHGRADFVETGLQYVFVFGKLLIFELGIFDFVAQRVVDV